MQVAVATLLVHLHPGHHLCGALPRIAGLLEIVNCWLQLTQIQAFQPCIPLGDVRPACSTSAPGVSGLCPVPPLTKWGLCRVVACVCTSGAGREPAAVFFPLVACSVPWPWLSRVVSAVQLPGPCDTLAVVDGTVAPASSSILCDRRCVKRLRCPLLSWAFPFPPVSSVWANGFARLVSHLVKPANFMRLSGHLRLRFAHSSSS